MSAVISSKSLYDNGLGGMGCGETDKRRPQTDPKAPPKSPPNLPKASVSIAPLVETFFLNRKFSEVFGNGEPGDGVSKRSQATCSDAADD